MLQQRALFHSSSFLGEEFKYLVDHNRLMTVSEIQGIEPTERTILQWRVLVDWVLVKQRPFVIVNPMDQSGLLYLTQKEYLAQAKVCASTDLPFMTIVQIGTKAPIPTSTSSAPGSSKNSPPFVWGSQCGRRARESRTAWTTFTNLRTRIHALVTKLRRSDKMVSENSQTIVQTMLVWALQLAHYAEVKRPGRVPVILLPYLKYIENLMRNSGQMAVVMHLKVALFALYSYIAGSPLKSTYALGSAMRLSNGLPSAWGRELRAVVRSGNIQWIRLLASLLNIYRAMDAPNKGPSVETISAPHPDFTNNEVFEEFKIFCSEVFPSLLKAETGSTLEFKYKSGAELLVRTAGANGSPAMSGIISDARAWRQAKTNHIQTWFELHKDQEVVTLLESMYGEFHWGPSTGWEDPGFYYGSNPSVACRAPKGLVPSTVWLATRNVFSSLDLDECQEQGFLASDGMCPVILGRLHAIDEPAGKVRVVAICDYWTQVAMRPVHEHLFEILRGIRTDATFDQSGRVQEYFQRGLSPHWSFDLKAATDTIPIALYVEVMAQVLRAPGETKSQARQRAELWAKVLTDRDFLFRDGKETAIPIRYGTGQPMGALSSWASMALVHHALVQFAAWRASSTPEGVLLLSDKTPWFNTYLVLGDDVDISKSHLVAEGYQHVCDRLAIKIGLLKSLRSAKNSFEFANRRFSPDGDISPLSLREELSSLTWNSRLEYAKRILARFGTRHTSPGAALLRKATTPQQWDVLVPELTGARGNTMFSRTVQFILQNPFSGSAMIKDLTVDQIIEWLELLPMEKNNIQALIRSEPNGERRFRTVFLDELLKQMIASLQYKLDRYPPRLFGMFPDTSEKIRVPEMVQHFQEALKTHPVPLRRSLKKIASSNWVVYEHSYPPKLKDFVHYITKYSRALGQWDSPTAVHYVHYCVWKHNMSIRDRMQDLERAIAGLKSMLSMPESISASLLAGDTPWGRAMSLLQEYLTLPNFTEPRLDQPLSGWLAPEAKEITPFLVHGDRGSDNKAFEGRVLRDLEENLRGPFSALACAVAQFGIALPSIPQLSFERAALKGKRWLTLLTTQLRLYRESFGRESLAAQYARRLGKLPMRRVPTASLHFGASLIDAVRHALNDVESTSIGTGGTENGMASSGRRMCQHPSTWAFFL